MARRRFNAARWGDLSLRCFERIDVELKLVHYAGKLVA
jgi:hypothetical protein